MQNKNYPASSQRMCRCRIVRQVNNDDKHYVQQTQHSDSDNDENDNATEYDSDSGLSDED